MSRKILLIESDGEFARELSSALEKRGFDVRVSGDGKEGLELARADRFDAIVLCVELPRMSGYSVCHQLKKDDALRPVPLVITSAEATPETFEQHRKLKTRAEDYLIKPFAPEVLVEKLRALVGVPAGAGDEEVVTLADVELEALGALDGAETPALDLAAPPPRPAAPPASADEDEDLRLLDDAFESIAAGPAKGAEAGASRDEGAVAAEEAAAAAESLPDEPPPRAEVHPLAEEADAALAGLEAPRPPPEEAPPERVQRTTVRGASAEMLRAAGIPLMDAAPPPPRSSASRVDPDLAEARRRPPEPAAEPRAEAAQRESELRLSRTKIEALGATVKRLETDLAASREESRRAAERAAEAERELEALRERTAKAEALAREAEALRTEILVARTEAEGARSEVDRRTLDLRRRVEELEGANRKHEERVVRAYQKIKGDEKLREKTRKALTIALQLLDEQSPEPAEKDPRAAARE